MNTLQAEPEASVFGFATSPEKSNDGKTVLLIRKESGQVSIRALLKAKGLTQKAIARKYGIGESEISRVVNRVEKTQHIRQKIALELDMPFQVLWE